MYRTSKDTYLTIFKVFDISRATIFSEKSIKRFSVSLNIFLFIYDLRRIY